MIDEMDSLIWLPDGLCESFFPEYLEWNERRMKRVNNIRGGGCMCRWFRRWKSWEERRVVEEGRKGGRRGKAKKGRN